MEVEVILKKTKITNSILKQALRSTETDFKVGEILGWCVYNKEKYILCYRSDIKSLSKYLMFKDIINEGYQNMCEKYQLKVSFGGNYMPLFYVSKTKEDSDALFNIFKKVKIDAETKGQIFV